MTENRIRTIFGISEILLDGGVETGIKRFGPVPLEGRFAIVTNAGRDAVDAGGAFDERRCLRTAKSCGPDAPTLASSRRDEAQTTVTRKPDHRGEHVISRKPLRRECRVSPV
jgi:hypothetical protein